MIFRISISPVERPLSRNVNEELQWLGGTLGLFGLRDKDKSCFRIFIELVKHARASEMVSSDELAERLHLTRGTVIHHINKLMDSRIVIVKHNRYVLRESTLSALVDKLRADLDSSLNELQDIAQDLDKRLELK
jgi:predicted transcriptional regulator